ncbi:hypothetical protein DL770_000571 [Monosporascus sp. CRB-9-2]|nr:hypothetical protein DL770_000571 [Monosporascus sp. CRB-9-2]
MAALKNVISSALLAMLAVAAPLEDVSAAKHLLSKRTHPSIDPAFNEQQNTQLSDGFNDALQLAAYAVIAIDTDERRDIFNKYFNEGDRALVRSVFMKIMGDPEDPHHADPTGSDTLGGITVRQDFPDADGDLTCDASTMAELRDYDEDNPTLIVCPGAFGHGGIGLGYDNVQEINCDWIGDRVTWRMDTMGSILLHEYTHMTKLVAPPLSKETDDYEDGYGPLGVRRLDKNLATNNADSYSWYANEALWTILCQENYDDPQSGDGNDPHCGNGVCQATKGTT